MTEHERHSVDQEFDLRCDACHARVQKKMRADLRQQLLTEGMSEDQADQFFKEMDRLTQELKARDNG